jgi:hypothetical protein
MDKFTLSICQTSPQSGEQELEPVTLSFDAWCKEFSAPEIGGKVMYRVSDVNKFIESRIYSHTQ